MAIAYLALGSNLGDRRGHLATAVEALSALPGITVRRLSQFHETEPVGGPAGQGRYLNGAAEVETGLSPGELLEAILDIERSAGRNRDQDAERWGPRTLDLDLLLYDSERIDEPGLVVPHPRMHERRFVLEPLAEIAPEAVHPELGKTVRELLEEIERSEKVRDEK